MGTYEAGTTMLLGFELGMGFGQDGLGRFLGGIHSLGNVIGGDFLAT